MLMIDTTHMNVEVTLFEFYYIPWVYIYDNVTKATVVYSFEKSYLYCKKTSPGYKQNQRKHIKYKKQTQDKLIPISVLNDVNKKCR